MNKIIQIRVSDTVNFFKNDLLKKYDLINYHDVDKPSFFYGIYNETDLNSLKNHKGVKIIIWSGTDINYKSNDKTNKFINIIKNMQNVYHIANSLFISNDLKELNINHVNLPVCGINFRLFHPIKKRDHIYIYTSAKRSNVYGRRIYERVIKALPDYNFIIATNETSYNDSNKDLIDKRLVSFKKNEMLDIYKKCFIGLRLTNHDGIAYTVLELGLCGIKCIHNGDQPNAIKWKTPDDIINTIKEEIKNVDSTDIELSNKVIDYLKIDEEWKNVSFYEK